MDKNYLVTKSNYFIMNSSYDLSLEEQKLILTLASMVEPNDEDFKPYKFKISEFMKLLGVEDKSKYTQIPKITKELMKKVFEIERDDVTIQIAWLSSASYKKGTGVVELEFSPKLKPYMLKLNSMFTQYKLANILSMKSKYSPRIYEILKCNEFKKQGCVEIEIEELRKLLKAENIYPLYNDLKRKIIQKSQKELKKLSDIYFDFQEIKTGRKVTNIKFYIHSKKMSIENKIDTTNKLIEHIEVKDYIEKIKNIMYDHDITSLDAEKIYDSAHGDLDIISKVYEYFKNKKLENFIGVMISMVKPGVFQEPIYNIPKTTFNDYDQRKYDYDDLENKLLGY